MTQHKKTPASLFPANMLVQHQGERVYTTSLKVAEHFGKRHDHVIRDIRALLAELPEEEHLPNFGEMTQPFTAGNGAVSHRTVYTMSHDGFALLAMGFTGREALRWKVAFLAAFRQMEKDLHEAQARYAAALDLIAPALRPVAPRPAALEDFGFAQSAEGTAQMVVFGDAWVQDWCVVGVGNYRTQPVRR